MRTTATAALAAALMATCVATGCGGGGTDNPDGGAIGDAGSVDDGGAIDTDGGVRPTDDGGAMGRDGGSLADGCDEDVVSIEHHFTSLGRVITGHAHHGVIQRGSNRLVAFGEHLSPVLERLPYVELTEEGGTVRTAAVGGDVPAGQIFHTIWHEGLDRFVVLTLDRDPFRYALHTMALDETSATFTKLEQRDEPSGDGLTVTRMYPLGADQLVLRGEEVYVVQVADGSATWSAPMTPSLGLPPSVVVADPSGGRLLGFGARDYEPSTGEHTLRPVVYERALPTGAWTELPTGGGEPPEPVTSSSVAFEVWAGYDATADRLLVTLSREVYDEVFMETVHQTGLWAVDLGTGRWQQVRDPFHESGFSYGAAWAVDDVHHRALELGLGELTALRTDGPSMGTVELVALDGHGGPRRPQSATALADGRLLALSGGKLVAYDPDASEPRWERFGEDLALPADVREGASLDRDPRTGDVWLYGGASSNASPSMGRVLRVAADGSGFVEESTTSAPDGRNYHATRIHDGELFVVGGAASLSPLDDVWALDLDALNWRRVASLPSPRMRAAVRIVDGELWVVGGNSGGAGTGDALAIDPATGELRTLTVAGDWPPREGIFHGSVPFAEGLVVFDLNDDTLDSDPVSLHYLAPDGEGARWQSLGSCFFDWHVQHAPGGGVALSDDRAFIVGADVFELTRP